MSEILGFDTETTGLPNWKVPSDDVCQPHLVQLAASIFDEKTHEISQGINVIIRPDGWTIPEDTVEVHGITTEHAMDVGIPEKLAIEMIVELLGDRKRVAYNTTFDNRIIRIGTKRYFPEEVQDKWKSGEYDCSMQMAKKVIGGKNPKLIEAYKYFTDKELVDAHSAQADMMVCMDVYWAAKSQLTDS